MSLNTKYKTSIRGASGIQHEVEIVEVEGERFLYLEPTNIEELLSYFLIARDINIPLFITFKSRKVPEWLSKSIMDLILHFKGRVVGGEE